MFTFWRRQKFQFNAGSTFFCRIRPGPGVETKQPSICIMAAISHNALRRSEIGNTRKPAAAFAKVQQMRRVCVTTELEENGSLSPVADNESSSAFRCREEKDYESSEFNSSSLQTKFRREERDETLCFRKETSFATSSLGSSF